MKTILEYVINQKPQHPKYTEHPKTNYELRQLVMQRINEQGNDCNLNDIDVSAITDFDYVFENTKFTGDISKWDVYNATDMKGMFQNCQFNGNISNWEVNHVTTMESMFENSMFDGDISDWNVDSAINMAKMFKNSNFTGRGKKTISGWKTNKLEDMTEMFKHSRLNCKIDDWNVDSLKKVEGAFDDISGNFELPDWYYSVLYR